MTFPNGASPTSAEPVLAIDIGATKFAAALVDADGRMTRRQELPVGSDPDATLARLVGEVTEAGDVPVAGVGIGSAGPLDALAGTVSPVNIAAWRGFPLVAAVADLLPGAADRPVRLAGDAQCMALGEWWRGQYGTACMLGMVVSTGVGGGIVVDGVPYLGPTGNAGHIGHITVDRDGERCPCGGIGCVETMASGPNMVRWALSNGWQPAHADAGAVAPPLADAKELAADARRGVVVAQAAFRRAADALATAILTTAALFDLDNVVIGGGVAASGETLLGPVRQAVKRQAGMGYLQRLRVDPTALGRDAGLYGAAALVLPAASRQAGYTRITRR
ncbi:ROK family protein [Streptosporangiaceae bacterium NEAU-GS5]|nr:ROK family protein [Streptosporangiaceae bacterium NEAU-GS5]